MLTHPSWLFRETIFRPLGVLVPQIFTHLTTPKMYFKSDVRHRAASCWALPYISSLSNISLPWQPGSVILKSDWNHSIAWPENPPVRRIDLGYIFYTSRVVADFVSNFVAMAAGVGHPGENLNDVVKLAIPENHTLESKITILSCVQPELWQFKEIWNFPHRCHCTCIFLIFFRINQLNFKIKFSHPQKHFLAQNQVVLRIKRENPFDGLVGGGSEELKKMKYVRGFCVYISRLRGKNPADEKMALWQIFGRRYPRRNHVFQIWCRSVKGFGVGWGSNFIIDRHTISLLRR